jgi:hypothetical protein
MSRAQKRNAVLEQKFYFRKGLKTCNTPPDTNWGNTYTFIYYLFIQQFIGQAASTPRSAKEKEEVKNSHAETHKKGSACTKCPLAYDEDLIEMTVEEIINGRVY